MSRVIQQARYLRRAATPAEKRLWSRLRNRQLAGLKFRRQEPFGTRIVEFYCAEAPLAVELDGSGHTYDAARRADSERELELNATGIRVIRLFNREIFENLDGVLNEIIFHADRNRSLWPDVSTDKKAGGAAVVEIHPHLNPLPEGEEIGCSSEDRV